MISRFIVLLSPLARVADLTKCVFLNNEPCMVRPTIIDINPVEIKYYPFMISLSRCTGSFNALSPKICVLKEINDINDIIFNTITNKDGANAMTEHISHDCKCKFNSTTSNSKQKWNNKLVNVNVKIMISGKKIIVGILGYVFVRILSI